MTRSVDSPFGRLPTFSKDGELCNVSIETPKGSRNTFDDGSEVGLFRLGSVLPLGAVFPFDFGHVPGTLGEDGDPLDVLVRMDERAFAGCPVTTRLIGVIEAEQTENDETARNDCLIAVSANSRNHHDIHSLEHINANRIDEIEHFFVSYNTSKGNVFTLLARSGPERARHIVEAGMIHWTG